MAHGTTGSDRPEFPDREHPLRTPDEEAQRQVAARVKRATRGNGKQKSRKPKKTETGGGASYRIEVTTYLPMEQHPIIGRDALAYELGVRGHATMGRLLAHPEDMDPWQVRQLCEVCGVTLEWLRGWEEVNAFGKYESAEDVTAMYSHLSNEDRALVCDLLTRLLGADATEAVKAERWARDNREWLEHHPEEARRIQESLARLGETIASRTREIWEGTGIAAQVATAAQAYINRTMQDAAQHARAIVDRYTPEEWELMRQTADRLKAQGVDADKMTPDELLAYECNDSVNGAENRAATNPPQDARTEAD